MLTIQNLSYTHPDQDLLFNHIDLTVHPNEKVGLIGNNGTGKSTLLKIIAAILPPSGGIIKVDAKPHYIPQIFGQYNDLTIAEALGIDQKITALHDIMNGNISEENDRLLGDDWSIEERCAEALSYWQLGRLELSQKMGTLSGGQKTKVFLAGISIHQSRLVLLDEPGNHLDISGKTILYDFIQRTKQTLVIVSHDRKLLNFLNVICELNQTGVTVYGGNYDFYSEQKQIETQALARDIQSKEKTLKHAKEKRRETMERQQRSDSRGKARQEKSGVARIMMNTLRNKAENSTDRLKNVHTQKIEIVKQELQDLRAALPGTDEIRFGFDHSKLHKGKTIFIADHINVRYGHEHFIWNTNLNFQIVSGERIAVKGMNGSGKTTLIRVILGILPPQTGTVFAAENRSVYIDQDYSLVSDDRKIYDQAQQFNTSALQEHEIKTRLNRFLFSKEDWNKPVAALSGGEKMRLTLCCLSIGTQSPDMIVLDEPTNNLDIRNVEILTAALNDYRGTLLVISHDETFLDRIHIERVIDL